MKKNFLKWMPMFIMALAAITFASCGDDKDDNNGGGSGSGGSSTINEALLIGLWEGPVHVKGKVYQDGRYMDVDMDLPTPYGGRVDVRADHTYTGYDYDKGKGIFEEEETGTWQLNGNILSNKYIDHKGKEHSVDVKILSATGNEFVMLLRDEDMKDVQDESELYGTYRKVR